MTAFFITAAGTDVGKTYVASGPDPALARGGTDGVDALKPVVSGFDPSAVETSDTGVLLNALGKQANAPPRSDPSVALAGSPRRCRPTMAAERENRRDSISTLVW